MCPDVLGAADNDLGAGHWPDLRLLPSETKSRVQQDRNYYLSKEKKMQSFRY